MSYKFPINIFVFLNENGEEKNVFEITEMNYLFGKNEKNAHKNSMYWTLPFTIIFREKKCEPKFHFIQIYFIRRKQKHQKVIIIYLQQLKNKSFTVLAFAIHF